jgi:hypothetical protein
MLRIINYSMLLIKCVLPSFREAERGWSSDLAKTG